MRLNDILNNNDYINKLFEEIKSISFLTTCLNPAEYRSIKGKYYEKHICPIIKNISKQYINNLIDISVEDGAIGYDNKIIYDTFEEKISIKTQSSKNTIPYIDKNKIEKIGKLVMKNSMDKMTNLNINYDYILIIKTPNIDDPSVGIAILSKPFRKDIFVKKISQTNLEYSIQDCSAIKHPELLSESIIHHSSRITGNDIDLDGPINNLLKLSKNIYNKYKYK